MKTADRFIQPMKFTGTPNTNSWAGYDYLQYTGDTYHPGLDYNFGGGEDDKGLPVLCIANGYVEKIIKWDGVTKGFGNHVFVKHELPDKIIVYAHYCHLDSVTCAEGVDIDVGAEIGKCGGSGGWPSHLHLEIRNPIGKGYEFWPKGKSKEWVAANYYDPYGFIEKRKAEDDTTIAELRNQVQANWDLYQGALNKQIELESAVEQKQKSIDSLVQENTGLKETIQSLTSDKESLSTSLQGLKSTNLGLTDNVAQLTTNLQKATSSLETCQMGVPIQSFNKQQLLSELLRQLFKKGVAV